MDTLTASPPRARVGVRRSQTNPPRVDRRVEIVAALSALVGAVVTSSAPTGTWLFDLVYRAVAIGMLTLAATRARRWTLLVASGVAVAATASLLAQLAAGAALVTAVANVLQDRRRRVVAALVMGFAAPALFLQGPDPLQRLFGPSVADPTGSSIVIGVVAVAPLLRSAWRRLRRRDQVRMRRLARRAALLAIAAALLSGAFGLFALAPARSAIDASRRVGVAVADGDLETARPMLADAAADWQRSHGRLNGPWLLPGRAVPLLGQHLKLAQGGVRHAAELTATANVLLADVDTDDIVDGGRVNTELLGTLAPATSQLATATADAHASFTDARASVLVPPLGGLMDTALGRLADATRATEALATGVDLGHELLGSSTGSTIVVMFSTPAEARGSGGFIGNWAEFRAVDGRVELVEQYRSKQLNDALIAGGGELRGDTEFIERYGRFDVQQHVQDVTLSPDFPSVARVTASLYEQATGVRPDAIMMIDPFVLQTLLAFSGPVEVDGLALTGANAADELLRGQYERFAEDDDERTALLDDLAAVVVERLLDEPPDPMPFVQEMLPLAQQGRLSMWFAGEERSTAAGQLGLDSAFPRDGDDVLAVVHQNAAQNKIDPLLRRSLTVGTTLDQGTGAVHHDVLLLLENEAPSDGLPPSIIGSNDQGLPLGTNRMLLSVYSPFPMRNARVDGAAVSVETQREFGRLVHTMLVSLPAGSDAVLEFELAGTVSLDDGYDLHFPMQPLSRPDDVAWTVHAEGRLNPAEGWTATDTGAGFILGETPAESRRFRFAAD